MAVTTIEGAIQEALFTRMASLVLSPVHPVSWPNLNFSKPVNNRYLEVRFVPNTTNRITIDSDGPHQRIGFLQVNVRDALNTGSRAIETAGLVSERFPADDGRGDAARRARACSYPLVRLGLISQP